MLRVLTSTTLLRYGPHYDSQSYLIGESDRLTPKSPGQRPPAAVALEGMPSYERQVACARVVVAATFLALLSVIPRSLGFSGPQPRSIASMHIPLGAAPLGLVVHVAARSSSAARQSD